MDFREYFMKELNMLPTKRGVTFTVDIWKKIVTLAPEIDKIIDQMERGVQATLSPALINAAAQAAASSNNNNNSNSDSNN